MYDITTLWRAPEVNPVNRKARSIPGLNPINVYGRVFTFSWFGFLVAFWSWYAFPPLVSLHGRQMRPESRLNRLIVGHYNRQGFEA